MLKLLARLFGRGNAQTDVAERGTYWSPESPEIVRARYAATAHSQAGDYEAAAADLQRIHDLEVAEAGEPDCTSEIRRAKYLQKAGQGDQAWQIFQRLLKKHQRDEWLAIDLLNAMRLHLQREGNPAAAIPYGVAHRLARVALYRDWKRKAEADLRKPVESYGSADLERLIRENQHRDVELCDRWLAELTDADDIAKLTTTLCKKAKVPEQAEALAGTLHNNIASELGPFAYLPAEGVS
ncbi:tetratricopeptide (TPR) repeat protein [Sphingomonas sp. F9_3S_D5_B_2]